MKSSYLPYNFLYIKDLRIYAYFRLSGCPKIALIFIATNSII